ncbi:MAG: putative glutathione peroxidase [Rhodospirillales bacterium]|nr:putative glutathione peroxidase [Rhodospirillales bacterium]
MRFTTFVLAATFASGLSGAAMAAEGGNAHQFAFTSIDGKPMPLSEFKGKTVLIVNTASQCGFTPQYTALEAVYTKYKDKGLVVVGVPSNNFGGQEPGSNAEIKKFCEGNYDVDFPLTTKYDVKGPDAHPFYKWAEAVGGTPAVPAWNFHKLLIGPDGKLVAEFPSKVKPDSSAVETAIETAMATPKG